MKPPLIVGAAVAVYVVVAVLIALSAFRPQERVVVIEKPTLSPEQIIWLARLMNCESGITESAVNPNDLDNTPSWGVLQFKKSTYDSFTAKYGIGSDDVMDAGTQVKIVTHWILNPGEVDWTRQFPACVKKHGLPPGA